MCCYARLFEHPDVRQLVVETLNLDETAVRGRSLPEFRRALVARQYVRVAVDFERPIGICRIEPGAGRQFDNPGTDAVGQLRRGETGATTVVDAHDVAVGDAPAARIVRMQVHDLTPFDFCVAARDAVIELAVQSRFRLVRDQVQRIVLRTHAVWCPESSDDVHITTERSPGRPVRQTPT